MLDRLNIREFYDLKNLVKRVEETVDELGFT